MRVSDEDRLRLVVFAPCTFGGTLSFAANFVEFGTARLPILLVRTGWETGEQETEVYSSAIVRRAALETQCHYVRRLSSYVDANSVILANDGAELSMVQMLGLDNPCVFVLHGDSDYYYRLAERFSPWVDRFFCVSRVVFRKLNARLPDRVADIREIKQPVRKFGPGKPTCRENLHLLFVGRLEEGKGFGDVLLVDKLLKMRGMQVDWTIVGRGPMAHRAGDWLNSTSVRYIEQVPFAEMGHIYGECDILVFPSRSEGFGLAVAEALHAGVLPIVYDVDTGYRQLVVSGTNAMIVPDEGPRAMAAGIERLNGNRRWLDHLKKGALDTDLGEHDPKKSASMIIEACLEVAATAREPRLRSAKGVAFLDRGYLPEWIARNLKRIQAHARSVHKDLSAIRLLHNDKSDQ